MSTDEQESESGFSPFEFPPEYAACISKITACWAALEYSIDLSIWHLAGVYPATGACITSQIFTLDGRLKSLRALLQLRQAPTKMIDRVNGFSEKVRGPLEIRNRIIHDQWFEAVETKQMQQLEIGAKGTLTYGFKNITIAALAADLGKVQKAMFYAASIRDDIEEMLPTLPEIPLTKLHPTVLHRRGREQTRSSDNAFLLFPPKPSQP